MSAVGISENEQIFKTMLSGSGGMELRALWAYKYIYAPRDVTHDPSIKINEGPKLKNP